MNKESTFKLYGWKPDNGDYSVRKELNNDMEKSEKKLSAKLKNLIKDIKQIKKLKLF